MAAKTELGCSRRALTNDRPAILRNGPGIFFKTFAKICKVLLIRHEARVIASDMITRKRL